MTKRPTAPLHRSRWFVADRIAHVAAVVGGALAASPATRLLAPMQLDGCAGPVMRAVVVASTTLLSAVLVRLALRAKSVERAIGTCVLGGAVAGALNAGIVMAAMSILDHGKVGEAVVALVFGTLLSSVVAGPLGLAFGMAYSLLVIPAVDARLRPSHAVHDRLLALSGVWLSMVGLAVLFGDTRGTVEPVSGIVAASLGAVIALTAVTRMVARRRFLRAVERGDSPYFAIVARRGVPEEAALIPLLDTGASDAVLVARDGRTEGPYRSGDRGCPVALVTSTAASAVVS